MRLKVLAIFICLAVAARAQKTESVYYHNNVTSLPAFPGGSAAMMQYITANLQYPKVKDSGMLQTKLILDFVVSSKGKISHPVVRNARGTELEGNVKKLLLHMPLWRPATKNGRKVAVRYVLPVSCIKLQE